MSSAPKRVLIIGGGVSGLAMRYFLARRSPRGEVTLLERHNRLGGLIAPPRPAPAFCERGPRSFNVGRSGDLLELIEALGLKGELLLSKKRAQRRFLYASNQLHKLPSSLCGCLLSPIGRRLLCVCIRELLQSNENRTEQEETVAEFARRRFGPWAQRTLFDPLTLGIYGGSCEQLSMSACFPKWVEAEKRYGSCLKGLWLERLKRTRTSSALNPAALFTLKGGVFRLIEALRDQGTGPIYMGESVERIDFNAQGVTLYSRSRRQFRGDHLVCALPARQAATLLAPHLATASLFFNQLPLVSLAVHQLAFARGVIPNSGFGYLVPTQEQENILGVVYDSEIFPDPCLDQALLATRLSVMQRFNPDCWEEKRERKEMLATLKRHLQTGDHPVRWSISRYPNALPQYRLGHQERVSLLEEEIARNKLPLTLVGNYLNEVAVNGLIAQSKRKSKI